MSEYIIAYFGGDRPKSPEDSQTHMDEYKKWLEGLGEAVILPMAPMGQSNFVSKNGVTTQCDRDKMGGYSIVKANSLEAAIDMAKSCPFIKINGTMEVAELKKMG